MTSTAVELRRGVRHGSAPQLPPPGGRDRSLGWPARLRSVCGQAWFSPRWYHQRYRVVVAMTLRLDEQETAALRERAAREGRSMQDVARQAVRDYIERTSKHELLDAVLDRELPRYAEALERLGQ